MRDIRIRALHAHHKTNTVCIVCTLNIFAKLYYLLLDSQIKIDSDNDDPRHLDVDDINLSVLVLDSSAKSSMNYIIAKLQDTEVIEFEAYVAVARNLIEKMSRLADIVNDENMKSKASKDFSQTVNDLKNLFEAVDAGLSASEMKKAKWLGRGTNRSNIKDSKYSLIYAYLSRTLHVSNMDTLLHPREDRFFVKAYMLVNVAYLYHYYSSELPGLSKKRKKIHEECYKKLKSLWLEKGVSSEMLIYCTTYYSDDRSQLEKHVLDQYLSSLDSAFESYKTRGARVVPRFELK